MIPVNITKEVKTLSMGLGRGITLKPNETNEQAIARLKGSPSNGRGLEAPKSEEAQEVKPQETK